MAGALLNGSLLPPRAAALLLLLLLVIPAGVLPRLEVNNAPSVHFPAGAPQVVFDEKLRETFPHDQVLVALFTGEDLFSDEFLEALRLVAHSLTGHPHVERTLALTNIDHIAAIDDGFAVEPLLGPEIIERLDVEARIERALADRFAPGLLVAEDASAVAVVVRPKNLENSFQRLSLERSFLTAVEVAGIEDRLFGLTGNVPLDVAELWSMIRDTAIFVPATMALGLALIWWLYRRLVAVVLSALAITVIAGNTVTLLVLAGQPFTLITAIIPPLMTALTVALCVHLFNAMVHAWRHGARGPECVAEAVAAIRRPALYTALTTAAGLASLAASDIQSIKSFGLASAVGALLLYVVVIVLLPPLIAARAGDEDSWAAPGGLGRGVDRLVRGLARIAIRRAGWVLLFTVVAVGAGVPQLFRIQAETDLYEFFPEEHPLNVTTREVEDRLTGVMGIQVVLDGPARDSLKAPERLAAIKRFQSWLEAQPGVDRVNSMVDLIEEMHWAFHGEDPDYRRLPEDPELISQYLFIYDGRDLYDLVDREFRRTILPVSLGVRGANATGEVIDAVRAHLETADMADLRYEIAGFGRLMADQQELLVTGQVRSLWVAASMIFLFMMALFRSPGGAALCMLPNLSPILVIFIVMGAFGIWLDFATAMIASVTVGIAVDDTIHVYYDYQKHRRRGASTVLALTRSYRHAGRAVVGTTLILGSQFLILTTSSFIPTREFGLLNTLGLVSALLFDLLLLPAVLVLSARLRGRR